MEKRAIGFLSLVVVVLCAAPLVGVVAAAFSGSFETLAQLADTVLLRYSVTTLKLVALVAFGSVVIGAVTAWLVATTEFPGRRFFEVVLVLPLAFPAYVLAYAYTDILDHPGIVQSTLRDVFDLGPRDYWFPEIRSLGGAALMLSLVLYPYVYLMARSAFYLQAATPFHAARSLGSTPWQAFARVSLPMARPAIAAGMLLVIMETIADFGTVSHFSVQTFATGIYTSWFGLGDRAAAAQLALGLLAFALLIASLEHMNRGAASFASNGRQVPFERFILSRRQRIMAQMACGVPVFFGAVLPIIVLFSMGLNSEQNLFTPRYAAFIKNTLLLALIAALFTVSVAILLGTFNRVAKSASSSAALFVGRLGYAVPGGVIAVGLLVPSARFDNWLSGHMEELIGVKTGLLITGSIWLMVLAYMVRFLAAALGAYDSGLQSVTNNMDSAARVLGRTNWGTVRSIHLPILRPSIFTALLIVFVDTVKELPATLILRPFNYDTLAVHAFRLSADERLQGAAVPSLLIVGVGLLPVVLLCRQISGNRSH